MGCGYHGALGHGTEETIAVPKKIEKLDAFHVVRATGGGFHSFFETSCRRVFCCGRNVECQLGLGDTLSRREPTELFIEGVQVKSVALGFQFSLILDSEGRLYGCGAVVDKWKTFKEVPHPSNKSFRKIDAGKDLFGALDEDGHLYTLYNGQRVLSEDVNTKGYKFEDFTCGETHFACVADGKLFTFGDSYSGKLGRVTYGKGMDCVVNQFVQQKIRCVVPLAGSNHTFVITDK